jgi:hypothetical protein
MDELFRLREEWLSLAARIRARGVMACASGRVDSLYQSELDVQQRTAEDAVITWIEAIEDIT